MNTLALLLATTLTAQPVATATTTITPTPLTPVALYTPPPKPAPTELPTWVPVTIGVLSVVAGGLLVGCVKLAVDGADNAPHHR